MTGNDFTAWVLRSPFHGVLSNGMMLITITGRKTGRKYTTPVGYYREGDSLWVLTSRDRTWWKNLQGGAQVELLLKRKPVSAQAEVELNEAAVEARMFEYIHRVPQAARPMKIRMENGQPNPEDIARTARGRLFVRIAPNEFGSTAHFGVVRRATGRAGEGVGHGDVSNESIIRASQTSVKIKLPKPF